MNNAIAGTVDDFSIQFAQDGCSLSEKVEACLAQYFGILEEATLTDFYDTVIAEMEGALFAVVMQQVKGNQCKAAKLLGISRGTLRHRLAKYGLMKVKKRS